MDVFEKDEILQLPRKYRPLTAWEYFGYTLLFAIPVVGFICLIIFSFNSSNINRRSFARSYFCGLLIALIIAVVFFILAMINEINLRNVAAYSYNPF